MTLCVIHKFHLSDLNKLHQLIIYLRQQIKQMLKAFFVIFFDLKEMYSFLMIALVKLSFSLLLIGDGL